MARTRRGFGEVENFVRNNRAGQRPRDGYFTTFWRLLLNYPELLAWENLWATSRHEFQAAIYRKVKAINPALQVGWHVWHNLSFSPFQRAEENFADLTGFSDFIRPALYNNVAGGRFVSFVKGARNSVFGDLSPEATLDVLYGQLNYNGEAAYDNLAVTGLSADYVERETRRAVETVAGHPVQIWPGIDIDVPVSEGVGHCTPASVASAVKAVFKAGATGIILSRNYVEMKPENLSGAGGRKRPGKRATETSQGRFVAGWVNESRQSDGSNDGFAHGRTRRKQPFDTGTAGLARTEKSGGISG